MIISPQELEQLPETLRRAVLELQDYVTQVAVIHGESYKDLAEFVLAQMGQFAAVDAVVASLFKETDKNDELEEEVDSFMGAFLTQCTSLTGSYVKAAKLNEETASKVFNEAREVYEKLMEQVAATYGK